VIPGSRARCWAIVSPLARRLRDPQPLAGKQATGVPVRGYGLNSVIQSRLRVRHFIQDVRQAAAEVIAVDDPDQGGA
jgi:hypothetical protein